MKTFWRKHWQAVMELRCSYCAPDSFAIHGATQMFVWIIDWMVLLAPDVNLPTNSFFPLKIFWDNSRSTDELTDISGFWHNLSNIMSKKYQQWNERSTLHCSHCGLPTRFGWHHQMSCISLAKNAQISTTTSTIKSLVTAKPMPNWYRKSVLLQNQKI